MKKVVKKYFCVLLAILIFAAQFSAVANAAQNISGNAVISDKYIFIHMFEPTVNDVANEIGQNITVYKTDGKVYSGGFVGTGMTAELPDKSIKTIIVDYDLSGEGGVNSVDISILINCILGVKKADTNMAYAANCSKTDELSIINLVKIKKYIANNEKDSVITYSTGLNDDLQYNSTLYGMNCSDDVEGADPGCFFVSKEEDAVNGGYFYMYKSGSVLDNGEDSRKNYQAKNGLYGAAYICYRSKDMYNWEMFGACPGGYSLVVEQADWCRKSFWAPEVIRNPQDGKYYMYFSASSASDWGVASMSSSSSEYDRMYLSVAVSDYPQGPFSIIYDTDTATGKRMPTINFHTGCNTTYDWPTIDVSPFFDDNGDFYLYFNKHTDSHHSANLKGVWGMKMLSMTKPDYSTVAFLAIPGKTTVSSTPGKIESVASVGASYEWGEGSINEAPFMIKHNGKYYLTYASNGCSSFDYSVHQAISSSPLSGFVKLSSSKGNPVLNGYDIGYMHGTAHHALVKCGNELWIIYHRHNSLLGIEQGWDRSVCADRVNFVRNSDGVDALVANGPSMGLVPLPESVSGYKNFAKDATVTVNNGSGKQYLTDEILPFYTLTKNKVLKTTSGDVTVTLNFETPVNASSIMVYNAYSRDKAFSKISRIRFKSPDGSTHTIKDLAFPTRYYQNGINKFISCAPAVADFDSIYTSEITVTVSANDRLNTNTQNLELSEIVVLGKTNPNASDDFSCNNYCRAENDSNINIDGSLNEECWQNREWIKSGFSGDSSVYVKSTGFITEKGLYLAAKSLDGNIINSGDNTMESNTLFNFSISSDDGMSSTSASVDMRGDCYSYSARNFKRSVKVTGEINSGNTDCAVIEAFFPWEQFKIKPEDKKPEYFNVTVSYYAKYKGEQYSRQTETVTMLVSSKGANTPFADSVVTGTGARIYSEKNSWDLGHISENKLIGSYGMGSVLRPVYFQNHGNTWLFSANVSYSTPADVIAAGGCQGDLLAGIMFNTGLKVGWAGVRQHGVVYNENWISNVIPYNVLATWSKAYMNIKLDILLDDGDLYFFVDGRFAVKLAASNVVSDFDKDKLAAVGLIMGADKKSDITYSNILFTEDYDEISAFIESKKVDAPKPVAESEIFADIIEVGGKSFASALNLWDMSEAKNGTVTVENASCTQPLWFANTGKAALIETTVTRLDDKTASNRETQPMAGIRVTDGRNSGYIGVRADAIVTNDNWEHIVGKTLFASWSPSEPTADIDFVLNNNKIQIYVDGEFITEKALSSIVPGISDDSDVAIGLLTEASGKNAKMQFADVRFTTDTAKVDEYVEENDPASAILDGGVFASALKVNGKKLQSTVSVWDISNIKNNKVIANNTNSLQPLWFANTGKTALIGTTVTRLDDKTASNRETQPMAGIRISDGVNSGYIGVRADAVICNGDWDHCVGKNLFVTWYTNEPKTGKIGFVLKNNAIQVYVNDLFVKSVPLSTVVPGIADDAEVAIGLLSEASGKTAQMQFANVEFTTDATEINEYIAEVSFDPSVKDFIEYARALGRGYENGEGSAKVTVGENTTIFIGDSFFDRRNFWTDFYTDDYKDADAFCAGIGSTTTGNWKYLLDEVLAVCGNTQPKNIAIHLGTNDLWNSTSDEVVGRLKDIFGLIHQKFPNTNIYYFGITHRGDNSLLTKTDAVNSAISSYSSALSYLTYVNTPAKITADMLKSDNLHPKLETYSVFVKELAKAGCVVFDKNGQPIVVPPEQYGLFSERVNVNTYDVTSATEKWDLSKADENTVMASSTLGSSLKPIYFTETGKSALIETSVSVENAQGDPMAGLWLSDGIRDAFIGVRGGGIFYRPFDGQWNLWGVDNCWPKQMLAPQWGGPTSADIDFVVANGEVTVYVDELYSTSMKFTQLLPNLVSDKDLAFGLVTFTDSGRTYDMTFSNIKFTTDSAKIAAYLSGGEESDTPLTTLFANSVTVNNKSVSSATDKWDLTNAESGTVVASTALGSSAQPLYFNETGKSMLLHTSVSVANPAGECMAGVWLSDGTNRAYIGVQSKGLCGHHAATNYEEWFLDNFWTNYEFAPTSWHGNLNETIDFVVKDGNVTVFIGSQSSSVSLSRLGLSSDKDLAFGLVAKTNGTNCAVTFGNVEFTTDSSKIAAYLNGGEESDTPTVTLFADSVTVNNKSVNSVTDKWDLTNAKSGTVVASTALGSSDQPLYFIGTGKTMALHTDVSVANPSGECLAGIWLSDGTNRAYIGVQSKGLCGRQVSTGKNEWFLTDCWKNYEFAPTSWYGNLNETIDFVVKDGKITVLIGSQTASVPIQRLGLSADKDLAFGLVAETNGTGCTVTFSDILFSTDLTIGQFARVITADEKLLVSSLSKWDISKIDSNTLVANNTLGTSLQPIYFADKGKEAHLHFTAEVESTQAKDPMVGIWLDDGNGRAFIGVRGGGLFYGSQKYPDLYWHNTSGNDYWKYQELAPSFNGPKKVDIDFVVENGNITVYIDDEFGNKQSKAVPISDLLTKWEGNTNLVYGLVMYSSSSAPSYSMKISNITFETQSDEQDYFAKYYANGKLVKKVPFVLSKPSVTGREPAVPAIPNATGVWEPHITEGMTGGITVNAIYNVTVPASNAAISLNKYSGGEVELNTDIINEYLATDTSNQTAYVREFCSHSSRTYQDHQNTSFEWTDSDGNSSYTVYFADNAEFNNAFIVTANQTSLINKVGIFVPGKTYYWFVRGNNTGKCSAVDSFTVKDERVRYITAGTVINMRDLGGLTTTDGSKVKYSLVYRGAALDEVHSYIDDNSRGIFNYLGMNSEIELRGNYNHQFTGWDENNPNVYYIAAVDYDPIFTIGDTTKAAYKAAFDALADESNYPFFFHCSVGADRTGTFAYLLYGLLGVSYEDIRADYELTSFSYVGLRPADTFSGNGSLDSMHALMLQKYGNGSNNLKTAVENFLTGYIGVDKTTIESIRALMLKK